MTWQLPTCEHVEGFRVQGLRFGVWGLGFRVWGFWGYLGFRGLGLGALGFGVCGFRVRGWLRCHEF